MRIKAVYLKLFLSCLAIAILSGCITPIQKLPTSTEAFRSPPDRLRSEYPEIAEYEKYKLFVTNAPYADQLISVWGEPTHKSTEWSYYGYMGAMFVGLGFAVGPVPVIIAGGLTVAIRPYPLEQYYWIKDEYCIQANIDYTFEHAYKGKMLRWKWHHLSDGKDIPNECK